MYASLVMGILLMSAHVCVAQSLIVKAYVDQNFVSIGQQFVLTIEISGADAQSAPVPDPPDISAFADFAGNSNSSNMQIINGRMSVSKSSINYYLARTEGKHQIPTVVLNFKGKSYHSEPITIEVSKGGTRPSAQGRQPSQRPSQLEPEGELEGNLYLVAEPDRKTVYQNEPVIVTYKIYTRVDVSSYSLSKMPDLIGFWSEEFELPQQPSTHEENVDGKRFLVAEVKKLALFPTDAGEKTIEPMEVDCDVRLRQRRRGRDLFDSFFFDDRDIFGKRVRARIASEPIEITVVPIPLEGRPSDFSGTVGSFKYVASLDKNTVSANEAITLTLTYKGQGNIKILPEPKISFPAGFETYEPKVSQTINRKGNTISGKKVYEYVAIPRFAGTHRIRPTSFSYFDPTSAEFKTIRTPEFVVTVSATSGTGAPIASGLSRQEIKLIGRDIRFIKEDSVDFKKKGAYLYQSLWFGLLLVVPVLAFGGALAYSHRQDKMAENVAYARSRRANELAKKKLANARKFLKTDRQKEFYAEVSHAMLGFVADKLNLAAAGLNSDEVADKLRKKRVNEAMISELLSILQECDFQRFAPSDSSESQMKEFYDRASSAILTIDRAKLS
jgi:hypothetical protein